MGCAWGHFAAYVALSLFDALDNLVSELKDIDLHANMPHMHERLELFVLIILGESIISIMTSIIGINSSLDYDVAVLLCVVTFVMSYCVLKLYQESQPPEEHIEEWFLLHPSDGWDWYTHQVLFVALLGWALGIKITGKHLIHGDSKAIDVVLPGVSMIVIVVALMLIRCMNAFSHYHSHSYIWALRVLLITILAAAIMSVLNDSLNYALIFGVFAFCITAMALLDFHGEWKQDDAIHSKALAVSQLVKTGILKIKGSRQRAHELQRQENNYNAALNNYLEQQREAAVIAYNYNQAKIHRGNKIIEYKRIE